MPNEWSLRHEILLITQRWPWLVLFCILGASLGWLASLIWPTPYRATRELYVGLNAYRAINDLSVSEYAGIKLVNANDYKNWQMSSLNSLIFMDEVIDHTLSDLQELDPYWKDISRDDFAQSLHVYWRNAGKWRLVAEHPDPIRAVEAVNAWQQVVVDTVHAAVSQSQEALLYELQLNSLAEQKNAVSQALDDLNNTIINLNIYQETLSSRPEESLIDSSEHWQIWQQSVSIRSIIDWNAFLETFPIEGSQVNDYIEWLDQGILLLDQEINNQIHNLESIEQREYTAASQFSQASKLSLGLSASLDVDKISNSRTLQTVTRPTGLLMLCGSFLALLSWLGIWISHVSVRGNV